jgi:hypothetical protein
MERRTTDEIDARWVSIDLNPVFANANSSTRFNRDPLSNVTDSSDRHPWKVFVAKTTAEDGIKIDLNPFHPNSDSSICPNRGSLSNVTDASDMHSAKLHLPRTTTEDGISIDRAEPTYRYMAEPQIPSRNDS